MGQCSSATPATSIPKRGVMPRSLAKATAAFSLQCRSTRPLPVPLVTTATLPLGCGLLTLQPLTTPLWLAWCHHCMLQPGRVSDHSRAICLVWLRCATTHPPIYLRICVSHYLSINRSIDLFRSLARSLTTLGRLDWLCGRQAPIH